MMERETFTVREEHIQLLLNMCVSWDDCEFGAPAIDCKRPYGNSDVITDILDIVQRMDTEENITYANRLHKEMKIVLQILVNNARSGIRPGVYSTPKYTREWLRED